jgi:hypothetical protein
LGFIRTLDVGASQIERARRSDLGVGEQSKFRDESDIHAGRFLHNFGNGPMRHSFRCEEMRARSSKPHGTGAKCPNGVARRRQARRNDSPPDRSERGKENIAATGIDRGDHESRLLL